MLLYFDEIDEAINTDEIMRIYQYKTPSISVCEDIAKQLEEGVDPKELQTPSPKWQSIIKLRDETKIKVNLKVKEIIEAIRKENG